MDPLQPGGTRPRQVSPGPTRDLGARAGHPALQNRVHPQMPICVCVTPTQGPERDLGREKSRSPGFLDLVSHSYSTSSLEVGTLETCQHMTVLNKVTLNKKLFFIYICTHMCIYICTHMCVYICTHICVYIQTHTQYVCISDINTV